MLPNDDPKLNTILQEGIEGDYVLIGYPHNHGIKNTDFRKGQELGPDCLRRFLPKIGSIYNQQYECNLSGKKLSDYGNIHTKDYLQDDDLYALLSKLELKLRIILEKKKNCAIVVGGTGEILLPIAKICKNLISIRKQPSQQPILNQQITYHNIITHLQRLQPSPYVYLILPQKQQSFFQSKISNLIYANNVKTPELSHNIRVPRTILGSIILNKSKQLQDVHLSLSMSSKRYCPGVSNNSNGGFINDDIIEAFYMAGLSGNVKSISITDFNPVIQDWRSGYLIGNLIYYFMMGKQSNGK